MIQTFLAIEQPYPLLINPITKSLSTPKFCQEEWSTAFRQVRSLRARGCCSLYRGYAGYIGFGDSRMESVMEKRARLETAG